MPNINSGNSIQYIIELDKKARERVAQAVKQAEEIDVEAQHKKEEMLKEYQEHSRSRLETAEQSYRQDAEARIAEIEAEAKKKTDAFDRSFDENKQALEKKIFQAVTGSERG